MFPIGYLVKCWCQLQRVTRTIILGEYVLDFFCKGGKVIVKYETLRLIRWQRSLKETWSNHWLSHFFFSFLDYSRVYVWEAKKWCFLTTWSMDKTIHNFHAFCALYKLRGDTWKTCILYDIALGCRPEKFIHNPPRGVICQTFQVKLILP